MQYEYLVRKLDALGRFPIPVKFCRELRLDGKGNSCEIYVDGQNIILQKYTAKKCLFCKGIHDLIEFKGKYLCSSCKAHILNREF